MSHSRQNPVASVPLQFTQTHAMDGNSTTAADDGDRIFFESFFTLSQGVERCLGPLRQFDIEIACDDCMYCLYLRCRSLVHTYLET